MTWLDFVSQLVELIRTYQVPWHEWAAWLVDRLTRKAQAALLNLTTEQRGDWAALMSSLNSYFHVEFEICTVEEELLVRKQGNKESVRDFIAQLMYLAQKAYGQDLVKRKADILKRLEFGLISASLRRTFDDLMLEPGVNLSIMQAALVHRETRDDPGKYWTFITQESEKENAKKPTQPSASNIAKEVAKEVAAKNHDAELAEGATPRGRDTGNSKGRRRGSSTQQGAAGVQIRPLPALKRPWKKSRNGMNFTRRSVLTGRKLGNRQQTRRKLARGTRRSHREISSRANVPQFPPASLVPCGKSTNRSTERDVLQQTTTLCGRGVFGLCLTQERSTPRSGHRSRHFGS